MSAVRPVLALGVCAALAAATGVAAAAPKAAPKPKPVCNLLSDVKGDGYPTTAAPAGPNEEALDIVSGDIATNAKKLTAVFRLAKVSDKAASAPTGYHLVMNFTAPGSTNPFYVQYFSGNEVLEGGFDYGYDDAVNGLTSLGDADGVIDTAKNEIRITVPLSGFSEQATLKPGQKLTTLEAQATRDLVVLLPYADRATSDASYTVGAPSCVTVGK